MQFYSSEMPCHTIRCTGRKPSWLTFVVTAVALLVESGVQCGVGPYESHLRALGLLVRLDPHIARLHGALDAAQDIDALHELWLHPPEPEDADPVWEAELPGELAVEPLLTLGGVWTWTW